MIDEPLVRLGRVARSWAFRVNPWTNVYGLSRTILAVATGATLAFTSSTALFRAGGGVPYGAGPAKIGLFCLLATHLEFARWLGVMILALVASGWRPRITGVLHWWVSFSFQASAVMVDGGDQITAVLTLLLLPVALTDTRRWHWQEAATSEPSQGREVPQRLVDLFAVLMVRLQVAGVYFHSSVAKLRVEDWANGTVLYYWFTNPMFGVPPWRLRLLMPLLTHGTTVVLMTWGALALELLLFTALVMPKRAWPYFLVLGIAFHAAIALTLGLISFGLAMIAALILYLRPVEKPFRLPRFVRSASRHMYEHWSGHRTRATERSYEF
jgi:antimicrobial peptide system SdpB family protein